jgi:hypothetical protein
MGQIIMVDGVIPLEDFHRLMPCNGHDAEIIHACPSHVRHERVTEIMEHYPSDVHLLRGRFKGSPDGAYGFAARGEYVGNPLTILGKVNCRLL